MNTTFQVSKHHEKQPQNVGRHVHIFLDNSMLGCLFLMCRVWLKDGGCWEVWRGPTSSVSAGGGEGGGGFNTICSPPALQNGRGLYFFHTSMFRYHTVHKHRSLRCVWSRHTVDAASPTQSPSEGWMNRSMTGVMTAHSSHAQTKHLLPVWLNMLSIPPGEHRLSVLLLLCGPGHFSLRLIWHQLGLESNMHSTDFFF